MGNICSSKKIERSIFTEDISNVNRYTYEDQYKYCRVDNIYDGDTADIYFMDDKKIIRRTFRFYGYDSVEIKQPKTHVNRRQLKNAALDDKNFLASLVLNKKLVVHFTKPDKYGRLLGTVWVVSDISIPENLLEKHPELIDVNNVSINMVNSGHGTPYFGGHKD